ncbi:MAG: hypothetical protein EPO10_27505 [Reyranella sp.]|uniref:hypothetical protein n=1 Tax=Reyranella sp. TaxID=1929291 RepID=UPI00120441B5|nr:hypothetical protein [Reyranella sp.]TAJ97429.1 MAG: hypothetical protein EPO41_03215 [Reyranella sp.]TBR23037.1 MAG: hypothetical protein EPO10_27505 [Reyranella sp.]
MSTAFDFLPNAKDSLEREAGLIRRAFELAARQPYGFTFDDLEQVEAYRMQRAADVASLDCVASLTDGRRFHLAYVAGPHRPDFVMVTQMMTTEPLPSGRSRFWIDDVAELNHTLGLPLIPPPPAPVILPLPARH